MLWFLLGVAVSATACGWIQRRRRPETQHRLDAATEGNATTTSDAEEIALEDLEPGLEHFAAGLSTELAAIATAIECHGQLLIEACTPLSDSAANHRAHLVRDMRRLRWLSQKVHASATPQRCGAETTADVEAVLHHLRRRMLELGVGPMRVEVEVVDGPLPVAACNPTSLRRALRAAIEVLLSTEPDPIGLFLRAQCSNETSSIRIETTLEVAESTAAQTSASERARESTRAMELFSTHAANNLLAPYDVTFCFDRSPGVFGRASVEVPIHSIDAQRATQRAAPSPFTDRESTAPAETQSSTNDPLVDFPRPPVRSQGAAPTEEPPSVDSAEGPTADSTLDEANEALGLGPAPDRDTEPAPTCQDGAHEPESTDPHDVDRPLPRETERLPTRSIDAPENRRRHPYGGILLVTEDASIRAMLMTDLAKTGRNVVPCIDRASARALLAATGERFELLVLEASHPTGSGLDLAHESLDADPARRIILLGAPPESDREDPRLKAVPQPFDVDDVRRAIHALLD